MGCLQAPPCPPRPFCGPLGVRVLQGGLPGPTPLHPALQRCLTPLPPPHQAAEWAALGAIRAAEGGLPLLPLSPGTRTVSPGPPLPAGGHTSPERPPLAGWWAGGSSSRESSPSLDRAPPQPPPHRAPENPLLCARVCACARRCVRAEHVAVERQVLDRASWRAGRGWPRPQHIQMAGIGGVDQISEIQHRASSLASLAFGSLGSWVTLEPGRSP